MPRVGNQEPTHRHAMEYDLTEGKFAVQMANKYGMRPHPWQQMILDDWLAVKDGKLVHSLCLLPVPRQNGKTGVCDPRETWGLVWRGEQILHTAQEFQTAQKAFNRLRKKFGMCKNDPLAEFPELNAMVERYTTSANQMVLDLKNGGHIEFRTRGNSSDMGRGGTFDLVVIDEAQSYTEEQDAALSPLNSAAPSGSPQTILMGTVPDPTKPYKGVKFASLREVMLTDPYDGGCIHEWSTNEIGDVFDRRRWYETNPSLGYQLLESGLEKDVHTMSPDTFAREHLGWWSPTAGKIEYLVPKARWAALEVDAAPDGYDKQAFGVRFTPDGKFVALAVCVTTGDSAHVEFIREESTFDGTGWLVSWLAERRNSFAAVAIDGKADVQDLYQRLVAAGVPKAAVMVARPQDAISSSGMVLNAIYDGRLTHVGDEALEAAVTGAVRRNIGTSGGFGFDGEFVERFDACALAHWAARTTRRDPRRKGRAGC